MIRSILIVDDEPLARKVIREYLEKLEYNGFIAEAGDALKAQKVLTKNEIDLLFLDINMPLMSGIELAKEGVGDTKVIFTTAYAEFAVDAFEVAAFDYLVKPISFVRFQKSFSRVIAFSSKTKADQSEWMLVKEGKRIYKVPYYDINYIQAYGDYVKIFGSGKTYLMKTRLSDLEKELPRKFIRSHRSYIIQTSKIKYIEGNHLVIEDEKIPISQTYREDILSIGK